MSSKIMEIGSAPAEPLAVAPGEVVGVRVRYRNMGILPGTFRWRLQLEPRDWLRGWNPGPEAERVTRDVPAGVEDEVTILRTLPSNWGAGDIFGKVDCRTEAVNFVVMEADARPSWAIMPASPAWIEVIETTYFVS